MILLRGLFLFWIGLTAGLVTAAGTFALITVVGIVPRLSGCTRTAAHVHLYETAIIVGGGIGNFLDILKIFPDAGVWVLALMGLGSGAFVGSLVMALAETLNVIPIFCRRLRVVSGLRFLIAAIAAGKFAGALIYFTF